MRLATELNGSKIKGHFPFAEQREVQSMQGGGHEWASGDGFIGLQWFCFHMLCLAVRLIPLKCLYIQTCVAVYVYCNAERTFLYEQN